MSSFSNVQERPRGSTSAEQHNLEHLHRWLTIGSSSGAFAGAVFFLPYGLVFMVLKWAAVLFSPYVLWRLIKAKRYGWITAFVLLVGLPVGFSLFARPDTVSGVIFSALPLLTFYGYTLALRHSVGEWLEELRWQ